MDMYTVAGAGFKAEPQSLNWSEQEASEGDSHQRVGVVKK